MITSPAESHSDAARFGCDRRRPCCRGSQRGPWALQLVRVASLLALVFTANLVSAAALLLPSAASKEYAASADICRADASTAYSSGFSDGQSDGFDEGYEAGTADGAEFCTQNPLVCGIPLDSCLPPPVLGETEPNDNRVAADPLPFNQSFWGQSYGPVDQDWFYIVTQNPNQNLTLSFSVPDGAALPGWSVAIRDAAGNLFAAFDTSVPGNVGSTDGALSYRVTLGFAGTYYIVVRSAGAETSFSSYHVAAVLQDSSYEAPNYVVGFSDVEVEPNDFPGQSTWLTGGVSMYGVINLSFDATAPSDDGSRVYLQGEDDWYAYMSSGPQMVTLSICDRQECSAGDWFVEVYDFDGANAYLRGENPAPLLAVNTDTASGADNVYRFGIPAAGEYYMRVNHKRLLTALCAEYAIDLNGDGTVDDRDAIQGAPQACGCPGGQSCDLEAVLPASLGSVVVPDEGDPSWFCPNGEGATIVATDAAGAAEQLLCGATCACVGWRGTVEIPENAVTSQYNITWEPTHLPPGTHATDAYQDYLNRPSPYAAP